MTVREIVKDWLKQHGYDGLYSATDCGCVLDDLMSCEGEGSFDCLAGYRISLWPKIGFEYGPEIGIDYIIGPKQKESS